MQKSVLNRIAYKGHVYQFDHRFEGSDKILSVVSRGVNNASTFTGFCSKHDTEVFRQLETQSFASTPEHAFLLAYRALCKELYLKNGATESNLGLRPVVDRGKTRPEQEGIQTFLNDLLLGQSTALRDLSSIKSDYDNVLTSQNYSDVHYYVVRFPQVPELMCSGIIMPEFDFAGNRLQDLSLLDRLLDHVTFSLIGTNQGGAGVFSWVGNSPTSKKFVASLHALSDNEIPHGIVRFILQSFENVFMFPIWWDKLSEAQKQWAINRFQIALGPEGDEPSSSSLQDDGQRLIAWTVTSRETNINF